MFMEETLMGRKLIRFARHVMPVLAAGTLLQSSGCSLDVSSLAAGLTTSIANSFITNLIFGLFNVGTGF